MADAVKISDLSSKLKDYVLSDNFAIATRLMSQGAFPDYFTALGNVRDEIPLMELIMGDVIQPGGKDTFTPTADAFNFKNRIGKVRPMKVDLEMTHTRILAMYQSYIGKIDGGKIDPFKIPLEAFLFSELLRKVKDNIRKKAVFKGVYNAAGTTPIDTCNGILKIVTDEIASTGIPTGNVSAGAAITQANAYDQVMLLVDRVMQNTDYMDAELVLLVSPHVKRFYELDYQATFGALPYNQEFKKTMVDGTNITLVSESGMSGTNRMICTLAENLCFIYDDMSMAENVVVETEKRKINMLMDWYCAPEVAVAELIWTNNYVGIS
jgi:hypothetical protein